MLWSVYSLLRARASQAPRSQAQKAAPAAVFRVNETGMKRIYSLLGTASQYEYRSTLSSNFLARQGRAAVPRQFISPQLLLRSRRRISAHGTLRISIPLTLPCTAAEARTQRRREGCTCDGSTAYLLCAALWVPEVARHKASCDTTSTSIMASVAASSLCNSPLLLLLLLLLPSETVDAQRRGPNSNAACWVINYLPAGMVVKSASRTQGQPNRRGPVRHLPRAASMMVAATSVAKARRKESAPG